MSKAQAPRAHVIPIGIPVSPPPKVERPAPKRKAARRERAMHVPWLWIVTGSSAAWAILILSVGLCSERREPAPAIAAASIVTPVLQAPTPVPEVDPEDVVPDVAKPVLPMRPLSTLVEEEVPPAEQVNLDRIEEVSIPAPSPFPPQPVRPRRIDLDPAVFASCEKVGTDVQFMKNPVDAFVKAGNEKKLVFFVHLSGNLEDPGFT